MVPAVDLAEATDRLKGLAEVLVLPRPIAGVPEKMQSGIGKLFLATLPAEVVAYVDADACFVRPATRLWAVPPGRVHAVEDIAPVVLNNLPASFKDLFRKQFPEVSASKGFNAGLFALRPSDWRDLPERFEAALARCQFPSYRGILDQPLLNTILGSTVTWLPFEYNTTSLSDRRIPNASRIVHYTGPEKPWMAGFPKHEPSYYRWAKFAMEDTTRLQLFLLSIKILMRTPRRLLARRVRRVLRDRQRRKEAVTS